MWNKVFWIQKYLFHDIQAKFIYNKHIEREISKNKRFCSQNHQKGGTSLVHYLSLHPVMHGKIREYGSQMCRI